MGLISLYLISKPSALAHVPSRKSLSRELKSMWNKDAHSQETIGLNEASRLEDFSKVGKTDGMTVLIDGFELVGERVGVTKVSETFVTLSWIRPVS